MARVPLHNHTNADNGGPVVRRPDAIDRAIVAVAGVSLPPPPSNPPMPIVSCIGDTFVRPDSTAGLGISSDGNLWIDSGSGHGIRSDFGYFDLSSGNSYKGSSTLSAVLPPLPIVGSINWDAPTPTSIALPDWAMTNPGRAGVKGLTVANTGGPGLGPYTSTVQDGATVLGTDFNATVTNASTAGDGTGLDNFGTNGPITLQTLTVYDIWTTITGGGNPGYSNGLTTIEPVTSWPAGVTATQIPTGAVGPIAAGTPFKIGSFTLSDGGSTAAAPDVIGWSLTTTDSGGTGSIASVIDFVAGTMSVTITDSQGNVSSVSEALV